MLQKRSVNLKKKFMGKDKFINGWEHFNSYVLLKYCTIGGMYRKHSQECWLTCWETKYLSIVVHAKIDIICKSYINLIYIKIIWKVC